MKVIFSILVLVAAFVLAIEAPFLAVEKPNPDLAYKALTSIAGVLMMIGTVFLINSTRQQTIVPALRIAARYGNSDEAGVLKWTIDEMVMKLTNCVQNPDGTMTVTVEYEEFVRELNEGPGNKPETSARATGIAS